MQESLAQYFLPLASIDAISGILFFFLIFDSIGYFIRCYLVKDSKNIHLRLVDWLLGFGSFICYWFLLGLLIEPTSTNIFLSVIPFAGIAFYYIRARIFLKTLKIFLENRITFFLFCPFLPFVFVYASLPPHYSDEMAYHFIAPAYLKYYLNWQSIIFSGNVLTMVPRNLDSFFILSFATFKTYSVARFFQFLIFFSAICYAFSVIKKHLGTLKALIFLVLIFCFVSEWPFRATLGFVDIANLSFLLLAWITFFDYVVANESENCLLSFAFWGLALGTKYTGLSNFGAFVSIIFLVLIFKKIQIKLKLVGAVLPGTLAKPYLIKSALIFIIMGGYWYLKNLIYTGNPIFPFVFPCYRFQSACNMQSAFFGTWTTPVKLKNIYQIFSELTKEMIWVIYLIPLFFVVKLFVKDYSRKTLVFVMLFGAVCLEFFLLKFLSGFYFRYHQHLQFMIIILFILSLPQNTFKSRKWERFLVTSLSSLVLLALMPYYFRQIKFEYVSMKPEMIDFALKKSDIYDWLKWDKPKVYDFIRWCEAPPEKKLPLNIGRFDPELIWGADTNYYAPFLLNCWFGNPDISETLVVKELLDEAKFKKTRFYFVTVNSCKKRTDINDRDVSLLKMKHFNNLLTCLSQEIKPSTYYFNYEQLSLSDAIVRGGY